jgi:hypothetical protein
MGIRPNPSSLRVFNVYSQRTSAHEGYYNLSLFLAGDFPVDCARGNMKEVPGPASATHRAFRWKLVLNSRQDEAPHKAQINVALRTTPVASTNQG